MTNLLIFCCLRLEIYKRAVIRFNVPTINKYRPTAMLSVFGFISTIIPNTIEIMAEISADRANAILN